MQPFCQLKAHLLNSLQGFTVTGFNCLKMSAIAMFEIDTSSTGGVSMVLMGDAVFQMEPDAPQDLTLFYVELLIKVEVNFVKGYIAADAALAPTSYVYLVNSSVFSFLFFGG